MEKTTELTHRLYQDSLTKEWLVKENTGDTESFDIDDFQLIQLLVKNYLESGFDLMLCTFMVFPGDAEYIVFLGKWNKGNIKP